MGKISPVSAKYIVHATIEIEGVVERPDVIGAIFGQTEGLLGADLELRELQRSGRIGRIEVDVDTKSGKTKGNIIIPSSLDKAETSIIAAALEIIQRIGPCNAKIKVINIEDVRISKRKFVIERAKELLKQMNETLMPDSQELADEVSYSVRVMEIQSYGKDRLPAGPSIEESDEVIIVEGRADVINLLKHGIKNAVAMNGTSCPDTVKELAKKKIITAFVDGDRGGDLIIKELLNVLELDFVAKAPDGKEVEELAKKEIHQALRGRVAAEQIKYELGKEPTERATIKTTALPRAPSAPVTGQGQSSRPVLSSQPVQAAAPAARPGYFKKPKKILSTEEKAKFNAMLEELIGTRGAYVLDEKLTILGKVPLSELPSTLKGLSSVFAIVFDGQVDKALLEIIEKSNVNVLVGMSIDSKIKANESRVTILTSNDL